MSFVWPCLIRKYAFSCYENVYQTEKKISKTVTGGRVVSAFDCYVGGLLFESGIIPLLKHTHRKQQLTPMLPIKRSAGVIPEVNLWECTSYMPPPCANKATHSGFETQRRHDQKSKTGVSVAPYKNMCPPKMFKK